MIEVRRYIYVILLTMFCALSANALVAEPDAQEDGIFYLEWENIPFDSICPLYTEVIPLDNYSPDQSYEVSILYPEWGELTASETRKMQQWRDSITEDLRLTSYVGMSRGQALLDVAFVPVVLRNGKYLKLLSAKMEITCSSQARCPQQTKLLSAACKSYTRSSKLSTGKWVKISITEDGIYQLTRSALTSMGFRNPDNVHLYGYGGHALEMVSNPINEFDDLEEVPLYKADQNRWLFWGNGLLYWKDNTRVFNPYARKACYFLTEEEGPSAISTISSAEDARALVVNTFTDHVLYENDGFAYFHSGRNLYDADDFAQRNVRTYTLTTPAESLGDEKLTIAFSSAHKTLMTPSVNGTAFETISLKEPAEYYYGSEAQKTYDVSKCKKGNTWSVQLSSTSGVEAHLDYLDLQYKRSINPGQTYVSFCNNASGVTKYQIAGMTSSHKVMRVGAPGKPAVLVEPKQSGSQYYVTVEDGRSQLVCFNPSVTYPTVTVEGSVENQNLHALDSIDMVIIVPESGKLTAQAERLAEAHRGYDGMSVVIVRADEVYNEFSSGTYDATAYRRLMKMLYDRALGDDALMPRYLLLFGDCVWDNRMLTRETQHLRQKDYLLCLESENSVCNPLSYVMEDYFGLLDDGEGANLTREKVDLGVGRFPVTTESDAKAMVDKTIDFISNANAGPWKNRILFVGDDGDSNSHMRYSDDVAEQVINDYPSMEVSKIMLDAYQRVSTLSLNTYPDVKTLMRQRLDEGLLMMNYTGHAAAYTLSAEQIWSISDFENTYGRQLPLWLTAACDVMPIDGLEPNLGETAAIKAGGGCLAFVGTARTVYATNNLQFHTNFCKYIFGTDASGRRYRLGDAMRLTKSMLVGQESTHRENKLQYILAGDPALLIGAPQQRVVLDSIMDITTGMPTSQLKAGMQIRLCGHVEGRDGQLIPEFNGVVSARVYDSKDTITCRNNAKAAVTPFVFTDRNTVIFTGRDSVSMGQFKVSFLVPKDIKYSNASGRIVFYAINDSLNIEANGYNEDIIVGGAVDVTDEQGPSIDMTLNGEIGGKVNSTPFLVAHLTDVSGINAMGIGIGHDLVVSVDDNPQWTNVVNDYFTPDFGDFRSGTLAFTLPSLPDGEHVMSLRAWDMLNNTSVSQMNFTVDKRYKPSIMALNNAPNPAVTGTTFCLDTNLPGTTCNYVIEVFDFAGRRLWMKEGQDASNTGQIRVEWDLRVGAGYGRISPGIYIYRATVHCGSSKTVSESRKLIVN